MQVHGPSSVLKDSERIYASPNDGFSVLNVGPVSFYLHTPEECDWLIKAAVEAKRLLSPPVITDSERTCDTANPVSGAWCHRSGEHTEHRDTDGETWALTAVAL